MNRRQLLALTLPAWLPGAGRDRLVMHTYIWQQELARKNISLFEGADEMARSCHESGFRQLELMPGFVREEGWTATRQAMERFGLTAPIIYSNAVLHATPEAAIAELLTLAETTVALGVRALNVNPSPKPQRERKTDAELITQAAALNRLGAALRKRGLELYVHHHDAELIDDAREWYHQLRNTDPALVGICIDVNWAHRGGQDPVKFMTAAGERVKSLHLRNSRDGAWLESVAEGDVDLAAVATRTPAEAHLVVELAYAKGTERTRPLTENLRLSAKYTRSVFGT